VAKQGNPLERDAEVVEIEVCLDGPLLRAAFQIPLVWEEFFGQHHADVEIGIRTTQAEILHRLYQHLKHSLEEGWLAARHDLVMQWIAIEVTGHHFEEGWWGCIKT